ncbi:MAG: hypothetical protein EXR01_04030 [Acetobacteraceae bacterium]|nr:hypothetical protein [Acetobacteraceae bacterium]
MNRRVALIKAGAAVIGTIIESDGPIIVMLPLLGGDGYEDFDEVAVRLAAASYRLLRPQLRSIGGSIGPVENVSLNDLATDIAAVIAAKGQGKAMVLGH